MSVKSKCKRSHYALWQLKKTILIWHVFIIFKLLPLIFLRKRMIKKKIQISTPTFYVPTKSGVCDWEKKSHAQSIDTILKNLSIYEFHWRFWAKWGMNWFYHVFILLCLRFQSERDFGFLKSREVPNRKLDLIYIFKMSFFEIPLNWKVTWKKKPTKTREKKTWG